MKKFTAIILSLALVVAFALFTTACDPTPSDPTTYNITVVYENGTAVNGKLDGVGFNAADGTETNVKIQFCNMDGSNCGTPVLLSENGTCTLTVSQIKTEIGNGPYKIKVANGPDGYVYDYVQLGSNANITITLVAID